MALSYLLFNKLKWFNIADNAQSATVNGRKYIAIPESGTVPSGTLIRDRYTGTSYTSSADTDVEIEAYFLDGTFLAKGVFSTVGAASILEAYVGHSNLKNPKWGGRTYLTHWYQRLKALITRKVVGA